MATKASNFLSIQYNSIQFKKKKPPSSPPPPPPPHVHTHTSEPFSSPSLLWTHYPRKTNNQVDYLLEGKSTSVLQISPINQIKQHIASNSIFMKSIRNPSSKRSAENCIKSFKFSSYVSSICWQPILFVSLKLSYECNCQFNKYRCCAIQLR